MNFVTNLNTFVIANEAFVVAAIAIALVVLQVAIICYAAFKQANSEDVDAASNYIVQDDELEFYATFGMSPWLF